MIRIRCSSHHAKLKEYAIEVLLKHWFKIEYKIEFVEKESGTYELLIENGNKLKTLFLPDLLGSIPSPLHWGSIEPLLKLRSWDSKQHFPSSKICSSIIPVLLSDNTRELFETNTDTAFLNIDVFGFSAIFLTRLEEWNVNPDKKSDHLSRAIGKESFAYKNGFLERPLVDEYSNLLLAAIKLLNPSLPHSAPSASVELSHDVDHPFRFLGVSPMRGVARAWKDARISGLQNLLKIKMGLKSDPYDTFDFLFEIAEKNSLTATYFLIEGHYVSEDGVFSLDSPEMKKLIARFKAKGQRIGLHGSFTSHLDGEKLKIEMNQLRSKTNSLSHKLPARQHYLRWHPRTPRLLEKAGANSDWSMGYQDQPGFRAGTSRVYPWFDLEKNEKIGIEIHPLTLMDATLLSPGYLGKSMEDSMLLGLRLREHCLKVGGNFSILWHNHNLSKKSEQNLLESLVSGRSSS